MSKSKRLLQFSSVGIFILPMLFLLTACKPIDEYDVINSLLPNLWVFLAHIFATLILVMITIWLVWNPTKKALAKRREYLANEIAEAQKNHELSLKKLQEAEQIKIDAYTNAKSIVAEANEQAYLAKETLEKAALASARKITDDAQIEANKSFQKLKTHYYDDVLEVAFSAASKILKKNVSSKDNQKLVKDLVKQIEKESDLKKTKI